MNERRGGNVAATKGVRWGLGAVTGMWGGEGEKSPPPHTMA